MSSSENPRVPRTVRTGGLLLIFGALEFIAGMIVTQLRYPGYSLTANYISDLGGARSPWALVFDGSVIVFGLCAVFAVLLVWEALDDRPSRGLGLGLLFFGAIGAIGVGVFPETTPVLHGEMHVIVSFLAFAGGGLGLIVVSRAMRRPERWRSSGPFTLICGVVTVVALVLFATGTYAGLGPGGMERLIVAPLLLWSLVVGAHVSRLARFAPPVL